MYGLANWSKRIGLSGLQWSYVKKHYSLIPIQFIAIAGNLIAIGYIIRVYSKHPEVTFSSVKNPEPWNEYYSKQYKLLSSGRDYSIPSPAPKYR